MQNTAQIKRANCHMIKQAVQVLGVATKNEMMRLTGLSLATCSNLVNAMVETGELLVYKETRINETGRPSYAYVLNANFALMLGIFAQTLDKEPCLHAVVTDLEGNEVQSCDISCPILDAQTIYALAERMHREYPKISVVGISVQGVVASDGSILTCDAPFLVGTNLAYGLSKQLAVQALCENDMNILAYGIAHDETLAQSGYVAALAEYSAVPPGAGLVADGKILRGSTNFAGEISNLSAEMLPPLARIVREIVAIAAVINPATVAIAGDVVTPPMLTEIQDAVASLIPLPHCPDIILLSAPRALEYAKKGLAALCLKQWNDDAF